MKKPYKFLFPLIALIGIGAYFFTRVQSEKIFPVTAPVEVVPTKPNTVSVVSEKAPLIPARAISIEEKILNLQPEMKINLSSLFSAQKSFHSEYKRYTTDLIFLGLFPSNEILDYKMGFIREFRNSELAVIDGQSEDPTRKDTDSFINTPTGEATQSHAVYSESAASIDLQNYSRFCEKGCTADQDSFEVIIVTNPGKSGREDVWIINQNKRLLHVKDGITGKELKKPY